MTPAARPEDETPARRVLEDLLRRAEARLLKGDAAPASLSMAGKGGDAVYGRLKGVEDFDAFHARIALAVRAGAVIPEPECYRDDGRRLLRLTVRDVAALARDLGAELYGERIARAETVLARWRPSESGSDVPGFPVIDDVLEAWRGGRKVRGHGPESATDLADAARAVAAFQADTRSERILRRASAELFDDSKRLEKLGAWLDLLVAGELAPSGLEEEQVWSALGLRKEPQPLLLAGQGTVELDDGSCHRLPRRWLGFPVEAVRGITTGVKVLLSIENLASFHEAAAMRGDAPMLLLYTGGMPSPAWRAAYLRLLAGLPEDAVLHHWGDIDRGGFRIAAKLAETARQARRTLRPWLMAPDELPVEVAAAAEPPSSAVLNSMCDWARRAGWGDVAEALRRTPLLLEQERLQPRLPRAPGSG